MTASDTIVEELRALEPIFHRVPAGSGREVFDGVAGPDFWEVGASGTVYGRELLLEALSERFESPHDDEWRIDDFAARELAPELYLVTYELRQDRDRRSRRCTIWRRTAEGWRAEYHQGTLV